MTIVPRLRITLISVALLLCLGSVASAKKIRLDPDPTNGDPSLGSTDAEIVLLQFGHYLCLYCYKSEVSTFPYLETEYIDRGRIAYVHKDLAFDRVAREAAVAAHCAAEQGKFWEYHAKLFQVRKLYTDEDHAAFGAELGLDDAAFASCRKKAKAESGLRADEREAIALGIDSTPAFVLARRIPNSDKLDVIEVLGPADFDEIKAKLDPLLPPSE